MTGISLRERPVSLLCILGIREEKVYRHHQRLEFAGIISSRMVRSLKLALLNWLRGKGSGQHITSVGEPRSPGFDPPSTKGFTLFSFGSPSPSPAASKRLASEMERLEGGALQQVT